MMKRFLLQFDKETKNKVDELERQLKQIKRTDSIGRVTLMIFAFIMGSSSHLS